MEALQRNDWTYKNYCQIKDGKRYEIINGLLIFMGPAPEAAHQEASGELFRQIANHLDGKPFGFIALLLM